MIVLTPPRSRRIWRAFVGMLWHGGVAAVGPALVFVIKHPLFFSPLLGIGLPALVVAVASLVKSWASKPPEMRWDRDGLHYFDGDAVHDVPWSQYGGHRLSWNHAPATLKLLRKGQRALFVDVQMFDEDQRRTLLDELDGHEAALPNMRLKLPAHVD